MSQDNTRSGIIILSASGFGSGPPAGGAMSCWRTLAGGLGGSLLARCPLKTVAEVRRECHARKAEPEATCAPRRVAPLFRDFVEGTWKEAHFDGYKPSTRMGVQSLLDRQLLPAFGSKPLDRIAPAQVGRWFDRFSRTAPGNANHALDLLTQHHQLRDRPRSPRNQPGAGREKEPETDALALSVPRRALLQT